jgi:hypothetical protein
LASTIIACKNIGSKKIAREIAPFIAPYTLTLSGNIASSDKFGESMADKTESQSSPFFESFDIRFARRTANVDTHES